jgi:DNA-binding PadR family transcriptional regulator
MNRNSHHSRGTRYAGGPPGGWRGGGPGRHGRHGGARGGGPRLRAGRMLSSEDLQLIILALLEERPRHGYDLIKAIQEQADGAYVPSPGMVYPALSYLEEVGHVAADPDGAKKQYRLIDSGLAALNAERERALALLAQLKRVGQRLGIERAAYERAGSDADLAVGAGAAALSAARRELKATLFDGLDASDEEQRRVSEILQRTIAEIRKR